MPVHANKAAIEDDYTKTARAHAVKVMAALRDAQDVPLQRGVEDVESLRPVEAYVHLADLCSKCVSLVVVVLPLTHMSCRWRAKVALHGAAWQRRAACDTLNGAPGACWW